MKNSITQTVLLAFCDVLKEKNKNPKMTNEEFNNKIDTIVFSGKKLEKELIIKTYINAVNVGPALIPGLIARKEAEEYYQANYE